MKIHKQVRSELVDFVHETILNKSWIICIFFWSLKVLFIVITWKRAAGTHFSAKERNSCGFETTWVNDSELFLEQSRLEETSPYKVIKQMKTNDLIRFILIYLAYHTKSGGSGEEKDLQGRKVFFWTCVL